MNSSSLKRTPLYEEHRALGARLVDFGGWEMPLHYGSQLEEHQHVRSAAGMFDVSHMLVIDLTGGGVEPFLRTLLANDVARLTLPGKALYTCLLDTAGGVMDDLLSLVFLMMAATLRVATPLILCAMGGLFSEKSGIIDVGLEGKMLMAAFFAAATSAVTGSA